MSRERERIDNIYCGMCTLSVFRSLLEDEVISPLMELMEEQAEHGKFNVNKYSQFAAQLYKHEANLSRYILSRVLEDENFYICGTASGKVFDEVIVTAVQNELYALQELSQVTPELLRYGYYRICPLPEWRTEFIDFAAEYRKRLENIGCCGYGKFASSVMFVYRDGELLPVKNPDKQRLSELYGYERERCEVVANTIALVEGKPARNVLLYGDAGTGKSSTVKAVVNEFAHRGLRLIELGKEQLRDIPLIIDSISNNPLKFIIFIDDLTFTTGEDCFGSLKAALEGSVSAKSENALIYATSNRRHLVRESFSDRNGDDIHRSDTMQETLSLSARFGLRVNFQRPDKKDYIAIASQLARLYGVEMSDEELALRAEQFAVQGNGRSPRTAKQFLISTGINFKEPSDFQ